jgi:hypothetical protein
MEDEFASLLEKLGYRIVQRRNISPSFDFVCDSKKPSDSWVGPILRPPWFSPAGRTAFSVKEGDIKSKDVNDLKKACRAARLSNNTLLKRISGGVLVTNEVVPIAEINKIRKKNLYCWDMRRLLFYSAKAHISSLIPKPALAVENRFNLFEEASCLLWPRGLDTNSNLILKGEIFLDDHKCNLSADDVSDILTETYRIMLAPTMKRSMYPIIAVLSLHVLGMVDLNLARRAYEEFMDEKSHGALRIAEPSEFRVFQYRPAPWASAI